MAKHKFLDWGNRSIIRKIFTPMIIVMVIQAILFSFVILWGGTIEQLNNNALDILNERVINRKNYLENEMIQRWSNVDESVKSINSTVEKVLKEKNASVQDLGTNAALPEAVISSNTQNLIYLIRKNFVTGAFIILTGNDTNYELEPGQSVQKTSLYIRDSDPGSDVVDNSDLSLERAPVDVTKATNVTMATGWAPLLNFSGDDPDASAFYYKPLKAAAENPDFAYSDLSYWSRPFKLNSDESDVITYSVPLRTENGTIYGVLGVEVSADYLQKILPNTELDSNKNASYLLAVDANQDGSFQNVVTTGTAYKRLAGNADHTTFEDDPYYKNIYGIKKNERITEDALGAVQYLNLYNSNTPFSGDKWALVGVTTNKNLFAFSDMVMRMVMIALSISLAIGLIGILLAGIHFTKPITTLVQQVKKSNPRMPVNLDKTNITEIDELAGAIETLSQDVASSASKLSRIIAIAGIPIAAFEINKVTEEVYCTDSFFKMLNLSHVKEASDGLNKENFESIMLGLKILNQDFDPQTNVTVIEIMDQNKQSKWIEIKLVEDDMNILGVIRDVTIETLERLKIEHERDYDILTNLLNRRAFYAALNERFGAPETLKTAAVLMLDLDNLKYINDTYGHDFGDEYIRSTANILKQFASPNAIFARISGDEFYALIYGYDSKDQIRPIISEIRQRLLNTAFPLLNDPELKIRASGGVAWYPDDSCSYEALLKYADFAMYQIKNSVKGEFCEFDSKSYSENAYLLENKEELNKFIDGNLVDYHFQPIVDIRDGQIIGYEALMRSRLSTLKTPMEILALAKSQSKLHQIEWLTWFNSLKALKENQEAFGGARMFINSISNQLLSSDEMEELEQLYQPILGQVVVELTEEERTNESFTRKKQRYIRNWGAGLALDDFGTGYNSDANLLFMTPDYVKIDMSIVQNIDEDVNRQKLLQNLVTYFKERKIKIIAEGVETISELSALIRFGVDYVQGFYLGRPNLHPQKLTDEQVAEILQLNEEARNEV